MPPLRQHWLTIAGIDLIKRAEAHGRKDEPANDTGPRSAVAVCIDNAARVWAKTAAEEICHGRRRVCWPFGPHAYTPARLCRRFMLARPRFARGSEEHHHCSNGNKGDRANGNARDCAGREARVASRRPWAANAPIGPALLDIVNGFVTLNKVVRAIIIRVFFCCCVTERPWIGQRI